MSDAGIAYLHEEAKVAYMQANIIIDNQQYSKEFKININQSQELIDLFSIAWEYYEPKLADQTTKNLKLTTRNYGEFSVKYESSDQNIITSDGIITQSNIDQTVTFKITITKGNVCKDYYKNVKVLKYTDAQVAKIVLSWVEEQVVLYKTGAIKTLPTTHPTLGSTITWRSNIPGVITPEGIIVKPVEVKDCFLTFYPKREGVYVHIPLTHFLPDGSTIPFRDTPLPFLHRKVRLYLRKGGWRWLRRGL